MLRGKMSLCASIQRSRHSKNTWKMLLPVVSAVVIRRYHDGWCHTGAETRVLNHGRVKVKVSSVASALGWSEDHHQAGSAPTPQQWRAHFQKTDGSVGALLQCSRSVRIFECGAVIKTYCKPTIKADLYDCGAKGEPQGIQNECIHYCGAFRTLQEMEMTAYTRKFYSSSVICCAQWLRLIQLPLFYEKQLKVITWDCF